MAGPRKWGPTYERLVAEPISGDDRGQGPRDFRKMYVPDPAAKAQLHLPAAAWGCLPPVSRESWNPDFYVKGPNLKINLTQV